MPQPNYADFPPFAPAQPHPAQSFSGAHAVPPHAQPQHPQHLQQPQHPGPLYAPQPHAPAQMMPSYPQGFAPPSQPSQPAHPVFWPSQMVGPASYPYVHPSQFHPAFHPQQAVYPQQQMPAHYPAMSTYYEASGHGGTASQAKVDSPDQSSIEEIRASLRECRDAIRDLTESRARRRFF